MGVKGSRLLGIPRLVFHLGLRLVQFVAFAQTWSKQALWTRFRKLFGTRSVRFSGDMKVVL